MPVLMPTAGLEARDNDVPLAPEQFLKIGLFAQLKQKPSLDRFPGTVILRRYQKGEVVCRQGEAGWTAFYILTTEDELALQQIRLESAGDADRRALQQE